jgi:diguanylate cyclase (GGDEF)-like protein
MNSPNYLYSAALFLASAISFVVAMLITSQRRPLAPGSLPLIVGLLALSWWNLTYGIFWAGVPGPTPFFWLDITYLGVVIAPTAFLVFAMQLGGLSAWVKPPFLLGVSVEPLLVTVILWTDPRHNLFFGAMRTENASSILSGGPVFWLNLVYSYVLLMIAFLILIRRYTLVSGIYRRQIGFVIAGVMVGWSASFISLTPLNPFSDADITPFSFTIQALFFVFALLRYQLFDLTPIARDTLVEQMAEGVIVLDADNRIVDLNAPAEALLPQKPRLGEHIEQVLAAWPELVQPILHTAESRAVVLVDPSQQTYFDVQVTPLVDRGQSVLGRLLIWRDISAFMRIQHELQVLATTDPLTQVYNRRHFFELAEQMVARPAQQWQPLALIIIDLDHFKAINDGYGHGVGDQVLIAFAQHCLQMIRPADVFARSGGEEFVLLLPHTSLDEARARGQHLCQSIAAYRPRLEGIPSLQITVSVGIAVWSGDDTLQALLHRADMALYSAKQQGRNRAICQDASAAVTASATTAVFRPSPLHAPDNPPLE